MAQQSQLAQFAPKPAVAPTAPLTTDRFAQVKSCQKQKNGLIFLLPTWIVPYAELMRLHKPAGYGAFFFPHLFGMLLAAAATTSSSGGLSVPPVFPILSTAVSHAVSCLFLRGAACSYNDALDGPYDRQVERCRHRPVARGAVSAPQAHLFAACQAIIWMLLLTTTMSHKTWSPAALLASTMIIYPFCKRFTNFPQVVLGFSLALGQNVGFASMPTPTVDGDESTTSLSIARATLYLSTVLNAMIYDTIYAHQDLTDDLQAGVMSMAIACRGWTKQWLALLSVAEVVLLGGTGWLLDFRAAYWFFTVGGTAAVLGLGLFLWTVEDPKDCWRWFCRFVGLTGLMGVAGLGGELWPLGDVFWGAH